jgi:peptide-methionine (S)-S-oxide reductase
MSKRHLILGLGAAALASTAFFATSHSFAGPATHVPAPMIDESSRPHLETAVVAGGCFWGVQGVFQHVKGVTQALSGYSGGSKANAHYEIVGTGQTGHAESVRITFDPRVVSYGKILQIYFSVATDPTELNHQGADTGTQYRSTIFAANPEQRKIAAAYIAQLDKAHVFDAPIVTTIESFRAFYPAEGYHQDFATLHPDDGYIAANDLPKIDALRQYFPALYRPQAKLVGASASE